MKDTLIKISFIRARNIILVLLIILSSFGVGYLLGNKGYSADVGNFPKVTISREIPPDKNLDFSLFWKVWDTLNKSYFDKSKIIEAKMVYGAIKGMVAAVGDPYTVFLVPNENKVVNEDLEGNFDGIGIQIGFKGSQLTVISPLPNTPSEKAGVKAGDYIVGIKDEVKKIEIGTVGISLPEAVQVIRGKAGTKVTLTLLRKGVDEPIAVEVERAVIIVKSATVVFEKDGKVAHLKLLKFGKETSNEWERSIKEIINKKPQGVIVDLRNNPGGYLQGAVETASEFLQKGIILIEEDANGKKIDFSVRKPGRLTSIPLVVLINEGSASASEIMASALKDNFRAKLVGNTTFGKGTIQEPQELNGGSGIHITTARWLTPSGFWVNEKGIEPDIKIEDDPNTSEDEQLNEAIKVLGV